MARILSLSLLLFGLAASPALAQGAAKTAELAPDVSATITALKRVPGQDIIQLEYEVKNAGTEAVTMDGLGIGRGAYGMSSIVLMDFKAERAFTVGIADQCLCSAFPEEPLAPGQSARFWAWFAPPASSPGPFAVRFGSTLPVMDVPVE